MEQGILFDPILRPTLKVSRTSRFNVIDFRDDIGTTHCDRTADNVSHLTHRIYLNLNCEYTECMVVAAIRRRPWCVILDWPTNGTQMPQTQPNDCHHAVTTVQIADFESIAWEPVMSGSHMASSYLVRKGLSRKAQLALQIRRYLSKHPSSILATSIPFTQIIETWNAFDDMKLDFGRGTFASFDSSSAIRMPLRQRLEWCLEDVKDVVDDVSRQSWHWILKPSVTNKGSNIVVAKSWDQIVNALEDESDIREWVLQRYVDRPLLIDGYKFHLRVYVLCVGALEVFVFDRILMLLAARKYNLADLDDIHNHLTNTARAVEVADFDEALFVKILDDLPNFLVRNHPIKAPDLQSAVRIKEQILKDVHHITGELFTAFENEYTVFAPMSNCFELFGLDFLIDEDFHVSLLEVNPGPDFKQTGDRLRRVIANLWDQTLKLIVDTSSLSSNNNSSSSEEHELSSSPTVGDFTKVYSKEWSAAQFKGGMGFT